MKKIVMCILLILLSLSVTLSFADTQKTKEAKNKKISRYPVPGINDVPEDIKKGMLAIKERAGFIPNVVRALAHRPAEARAFQTYAAAIMDKESGLTKAEKEMIIVAHSSYNKCTYCIVSHGASLRMLTQKPMISEQIAANYHEADISPRQKAMLDFAIKVTTESYTIKEKDFEKLHSHGFSDEDIWDIAAITAFFNLSNRMMNFLAVQPDLELSKLGRE